MADKPVVLTAQQEAFALAVASGKSQADAYREAYPRSKKWKDEVIYVKASELMANGKVLVRVAALRDEITAPAKKKLAIDKEWVLRQLIENVAMAKSAEPVLDNEGNPVGEYKQNLAAANKALELIGKEFGMFVDRKEIRTGNLDELPHEDKVAALDLVRQEIERRKSAGAGLH